MSDLDAPGDATAGRSGGSLSSACGLGPVSLSAILAVVALYAIVALGEALRWGGTPGIKWLADGGWTLASMLACVACLHTARRTAGRDQRAWTMFAIGCGCWLFGQVAWDYFDLVGPFPPSPTLADVGYLAFIPAIFAGLSVVGGGGWRDRVTLALDVAVLGLAATVLFDGVLWHAYQHSSLSPAGRITVALYPILYTTLSVTVLLILFRGSRRTIAMQLLLLGTAMEAISFILWSPLLLQNTFVEGTPLDTAWMLGMLLLAGAALSFEGFAEVDIERQANGVVSLFSTGVGGAISVGVLLHLLSTAASSAEDRTLMILFTGIAALMVVRLGVTLRTNRQRFLEVREARNRAVVAADALRSSEEQFRTVFEASADAICRTTLDGRILQSNRAMQEFLGYTGEELTGMSFAHYTHPGDLAMDQSLFEELIAGRRDQDRLEKRYVRKDGQIRWGRLSVSLARDGQGRPESSVAVMTDVSRERGAREALEVAHREVERSRDEAQRTAVKLLQSETRYRQMFERNHAVKLLVDPGSCLIVDANPAAAEFYGYALDDIRGMSLCRISVGSSAGVAEGLERSARGQNPRVISRHRQSCGDIRDVEIYASPIDIDGRPHVHCIIHDVTDRLRAENENRLLAALVQSAEDAIIGLDRTGIIVSWNRGATKLYGYTAAEAVGCDAVSLLAPVSGSHPVLLAAIREGGTVNQYERTHERKDGRSTDVSVNVSPVCDDRGAITGTALIVRDVTERKRHEEMLRHQALHDALTGLPNRTLLFDRLDQALVAGQRAASPLALLLLDLNRFKEVNDTLGHHTGDQLLQEVASRLQDALRGSDTVARLGGDEFAIILPAVDATGAEQVAEKIHETLSRPLVLESHRVDLSGSIGIAMYPEDGVDTKTLLQHADVAMYVAKRTGGLHQLYAPQQDIASVMRLALAGDLRQAIEQETLVLHYQPQVNIRTNCGEHVEALVRWPHPEHGLISPSEFIPLAEETGLIGPLSLWVLRTALQQCAAWQQAGMDMSVAVNLSTRNLDDPHLTDTIGWMLRSSGVKPSALTVEITESALMQNADGAQSVLDRLHTMGVKISIDDFGTGYSSLAYLKQLPVDEIKIDRSFISSMTQNGDVIVRAVIDLARNLDLSVIAEGVENRNQWDQLAHMGCDMVQGYYLSRPLPSEDVLPWIHAWSARPMMDTSNQKVLIVDDNPVYQELVELLLTAEGYDVTVAATAEEALLSLQSRKPDLIVTDIQLPQMSGLDLVETIRRDETLSHTVVVAMTGAPLAKDRKRARTIGCNVYTSKPKNNGDLVRLVQSALASA